jgi:branched-chain amino acid transport system permease protein
VRCHRTGLGSVRAIDYFLDAVIRGLQVGSVYAMVGLGLGVIFTSTGVLNFAQGDFVMVGALLGLALWFRMDWPFLLALLAVIGAGAVLGAGTEIVAVRRPLRRQQSSIAWVISTLAVSLLIEAGARYYLRPGSFPVYIPWGPFTIGSQLLVPQRVVMLPIAVAMTAVVAVWMARSRWGRALRAIAFDREGAAMRGVPVGLVSVVAFALGGAIAGAAGMLAGPVTQASYSVGIPSTLQGFVAATIGGITHPWGPLVGGLALGVTLQFTTAYWDASYANVVELVVLLVVLVVRPVGVLGQRFRSV